MGGLHTAKVVLYSVDFNEIESYSITASMNIPIVHGAETSIIQAVKAAALALSD